MADFEQSLLTDGDRLPFSNDAEQSILGAVLIDPAVMDEVVLAVKPNYFYVPQNRAVFEILSEMRVLGKPIDYVALLEAIKSEGLMSEQDGKNYIEHILELVPSAKNVGVYLDIVRERYYVRALIVASREIIEAAESGDGDASSLLDAAEQKIYNIRQDRDIDGLHHIKDIIENETYVRLTKISNPETRDEYMGIPTGIAQLDRIITGLNKSDLIIVGARPGMGKTSFALNIAANVALKRDKTVCFFSLEMSRDQIAQRLISSMAMIQSEKFRGMGEISKEEWTRIAQAGTELSKSRIYVDETSDITVAEMKAKLRRMPKVDLVIVDYLGLVKPSSKKENRVQEVQDITKNLKNMAKELKVPVLVCAQLSRGNAVSGGKSRASHKPGLTDLRESGSIEQDADIVMLLYRESYYADKNDDPENVPDPHKAECIIAKNRNGETGTVDLYWDGASTRFTAVDNLR